MQSDIIPIGKQDLVLENRSETAPKGPKSTIYTKLDSSSEKKHVSIAMSQSNVIVFNSCLFRG